MWGIFLGSDSSIFTVFSNFRIDGSHLEGGRRRGRIARSVLVQVVHQRRQHLAVGRHVDVLPQQVDHEEISDLDPAHQVLDLVGRGRAEATLEGGLARRRHHDDGRRVEDGQPGQDRQQDEPEPVCVWNVGEGQIWTGGLWC